MSTLYDSNAMLKRIERQVNREADEKQRLIDRDARIIELLEKQNELLTRLVNRGNPLGPF